MMYKSGIKSLFLAVMVVGISFISLSAIGQGYEGEWESNLNDDPHVSMRTEALSGLLYSNGPQDEWTLWTTKANGFRWLESTNLPGRSFFWEEKFGIYFEHVLNGSSGDNWRSVYTPEKDPCFLSENGANDVTLAWPAEGSSWNMDCSTRFKMTGNQIDLWFSVKPKSNVWPKGFISFMWASYMNQAVSRHIYYYGLNDWLIPGWWGFGDDNPNSWSGQLDMGSIRALGSPELKYDQGVAGFNIMTEPRRRFILPLYYGILDGDGDLTTTTDKLCWLVMFDQAKPIRLTMFNWSGNSHGPAWDWQYVIAKPQVGKTYSYRARVSIFPWKDDYYGRLDVMAKYYGALKDWR